MTGFDYQRAYEADAEREAVRRFRQTIKNTKDQPSYVACALIGMLVAWCWFASLPAIGA